MNSLPLRRTLAGVLDADVLRSIAAQMMSGPAVEVQGQSLRVRRTSGQHLRMVNFRLDNRDYDAIEQNPEKPSRWGQLARQGHHVVQFKEVQTNRFVAVAVDGEVHVYGARRAS